MTDGDCCRPLACTQGVCTTPANLCSSSGLTCAVDSDCCTGLTCMSSVCTKTTTCRAADEACAATADCCTPMVCKVGRCTLAVVKAALGDPCKTNADCASGRCDGYTGSTGNYCTTVCTTTAMCLAGAVNQNVGCIKFATENLCAPTCMTSADCKGLAMDWTCVADYSMEGAVKGVCGYFTNGAIGAPCFENSQCASNSCTGWCTEPCPDDATCGTGATCLLNAQQSYRCFPKCQMDSDCALYGSTITCKQTVSRGGATVSVCAKWN